MKVTLVSLEKKNKTNRVILFFVWEKMMSVMFILEIHAGAGGTESQDWAEMLRNVY